MMTETKDLPNDEKYLIFQALSHPLRVRILMFVEGEELTFSSLKRKLGMESSGQLQHHLQKLSGLIVGQDNGSYRLTSAGRKALEIYRESEKSGAPLRDLCFLPAPSEMAHDKQISRAGTLLRFSIGSLLSALTVAMVANYVIAGQAYLRLLAVGSTPVSLWIGDAILSGFFGVSFLISGVTGYPGCEITAIPNLFWGRKRYCSCLITPFNLPNGSLLQRERQR